MLYPSLENSTTGIAILTNQNSDLKSRKTPKKFPSAPVFGVFQLFVNSDFKIRTFLKRNIIWKNLPRGFKKPADLLSKRQNHEEVYFLIICASQKVRTLTDSGISRLKFQLFGKADGFSYVFVNEQGAKNSCTNCTFSKDT